MSTRLKDKVAVVLGAGSSGPGWGNGKAAAVLFAREGAKIFAVDLRHEVAEETREIIAAASNFDREPNQGLKDVRIIFRYLAENALKHPSIPVASGRHNRQRRRTLFWMKGPRRRFRR